MDYRKFLGQEERLLFPYLGGPTVEGHGRLVRVKERPARGWHVFRVVGRNAWPVEPASAPDEARVPVARGHHFGGYLFADGGCAGELQLTGEGQLEAFAPCKALRWSPNDLILAGVDFETEAEGLVREALEEMRPISAVREVPATLRLAYGFALLSRRARQLAMDVAPTEVGDQLASVAQMGVSQASFVLQRLSDERSRAARQALVQRALGASPATATTTTPAAPAPVAVAPPPPVLTEAQRQRLSRREREADDRQRKQERAGRLAAPRASTPKATLTNASERAEDVLEAAGARPSATRLLDNSRLEVQFRFMNQRFITVVDPLSLQVIDAGICLAGSDRMVTLDSLPSVIREAVATHRLVITRR